MPSVIRSLTSEVLSLIEAEDVVGLATHRHYPHERMVYGRFGRCGFSVDVVKMENQAKRLYSVLVEAQATFKGDSVKSFADLPGKVTFTIAKIGANNIKHTVRTGTYSNSQEFFAAVEEVRQSFYRKYRELKRAAEKEAETVRVSEEVFHQVGLSGDDLHLGV